MVLVVLIDLHPSGKPLESPEKTNSKGIEIRVVLAVLVAPILVLVFLPILMVLVVSIIWQAPRKLLERPEELIT